MNGIEGELCDQKSGKKVLSIRRKKSIEESIYPNQLEAYLQEGWQVKRQGKTRIRVSKPKEPDEIFEDRVWQLFYALNFDIINVDRNLKLNFGVAKKQIDVLAKDENNVFIVECKSSQQDPVNVRETIQQFLGMRNDIQKVLRNKWREKCGRVNIVIVISSEQKREEDNLYVKQNKDKNIFLWSSQELRYIESLIDAVGHAAKYQLYSVIFADKEQKSMASSYPAIRAKIGGHRFYSFLIPAKELLKYAYVHHRELCSIVEASQVYQRMLRNNKLRQIARFIDKEDGYFPNSIIVNFSKSIQWDNKNRIDDVEMGVLRMPKYYGSAWIIDGQHRLYGAAQAENDILLPVLAFEKIDEKSQANLFVEINEKQTAVPANLLWDLYSDIYRESSDEKQRFLYQIAEIAKGLNSSGPLKGYIDIPSVPASGKVKLTLTTVCEAIKRCSSCWDYLIHPTDESKTPETACRSINTYFEALSDLWPEEWARGMDGVVLTNNGFGVFMIVLRDILRHIGYTDTSGRKRPAILQEHKKDDLKKHLSDNYLKMVVEYLKSDSDLQQDIKTKTGRGPQDDHATYLEMKIQEWHKDFSSPLIESNEKPIKKPTAFAKLEEKANSAEKLLRSFVLDNLKRIYGSSQWWKQGLPGGVKKELDDRWQKEINEKPYLAREATNERKFEFSDLGKMMSIVVYGENWEAGFKDIFGSKESFQQRIKQIKVLRDPSSHRREIDDQDRADAVAGLHWLSKCIDQTILNPYI